MKLKVLEYTSDLFLQPIIVELYDFEWEKNGLIYLIGITLRKLKLLNVVYFDYICYTKKKRNVL